MRAKVLGINDRSRNVAEDTEIIGREADVVAVTAKPVGQGVESTGFLHQLWFKRMYHPLCRLPYNPCIILDHGGMVRIMDQLGEYKRNA